MAFKSCKHCTNEFESDKTNALYCSNACRQRDFQNKKESESQSDLAALRNDIANHREEGKKIISHFKQMEAYYSDWEDRLVQIEKRIAEAEEGLGLTRDEVVEYDVLAELNQE